MIRRLTLATAVLALTLLLAPAAHAGPEPGYWEFHVFGAKANLDSEDPLDKEKSLGGDVDGDGDLSSGTFTRSTTLDDNGFLGFRLGYIWTTHFETEIGYDRNHTGGDYEHTIVDHSSGLVEQLEGRIGAIFTSYQFGGMYHPLGSWRTPWQPYATVSAGWIDVDFDLSETLKHDYQESLAGSFFKIDFPQGDNGPFMGAGVGLKYCLNTNVVFRAEIRAKTYEIFSERRTDSEISLGVSFMAPGDAW